MDLNSRIKFTCVRCDLCCGTGPNVVLTVFDVIRMAEYLGKHWRSFIHDYTKIIVAELFAYIALRDKGNGECIFMERDHEGRTYCLIYKARPMRCRLYPLYIVTPKSRYLHLDTECPGVGLGEEKRIPLKLVERYSYELAYQYKELVRLVVDEGVEPLKALEQILDKLWDEAEQGAKWADYKYIESLETL